MLRVLLLAVYSLLCFNQAYAQDIKHVQSPMWSSWFTTPDQFDYSSKYAVGPGAAISRAKIEIEDLDVEAELDSKQLGVAGHVRILPEMGVLLSVDRVWTEYELKLPYEIDGTFIELKIEDVWRRDTIDLGAGYAIGDSLILGLKIREHMIYEYDDVAGKQTLSYFTPTLGVLVKLGEEGDLTVESSLDSSDIDKKTVEDTEYAEFDYTASTLNVTYNHRLTPTVATGLKLSHSFYNRKNDEENAFYSEELKFMDKTGIGLMSALNFGTSAYTQFILSHRGKANGSGFNIRNTGLEINPVFMLSGGGTIGGAFRYFFGKDRDNSGDPKNKYEMDGYTIGLTGGIHI